MVGMGEIKVTVTLTEQQVAAVKDWCDCDVIGMSGSVLQTFRAAVRALPDPPHPNEPARKKVRRVLRKHSWDTTNDWCAGEGYRFPSPRFKSYEHHLAEEIVAALVDAGPVVEGWKE